MEQRKFYTVLNCHPGNFLCLISSDIFTFADCGPLKPPENGSVDMPMGTTFRSIVEYSCETGFDLDGTARVQCLEDGQWSDPAPVCDIKGYHSCLKFSDRQTWEISVNPNQTAQGGLIRVYSVWHSISIFWVHYSIVKLHCSNFRISTAVVAHQANLCLRAFRHDKF